MIRASGTKRGFTLLELMVVIAMIAMIMGAITTSMSSASERARIQKATSEVKSLTQAILAYENHAEDHTLKASDRVEVNTKNLNFIFGKADPDTPVMIQAALSADGVMRDPWGKPYLVTIHEGSVGTPPLDPVRTGYYLPNYNSLTKEERK